MRVYCHGNAMHPTFQAGPARPFSFAPAAVRSVMWRLEPDEAYAAIAGALRAGSSETAVRRLLSGEALAASPQQTAARFGFDLVLFGVELPDAAAAELARRLGDDASAGGGGRFGAWRRVFGLLASIAAAVAPWPVERMPAEHDGAPPGEPDRTPGPGQDDAERAAAIWAAAEAGTSLAFAAARALDVAAARGGDCGTALASRGVASGEGRRVALEQAEEEAVELVELGRRPASQRDPDRGFALQADRVVQFVLAKALADVLAPASCVWDATRGYQAAGELASLPRGPGKSGVPLAAGAGAPAGARAARRSLADAMTEPVFLALYRGWIGEMREIASRRPGTGACTVATAMQLWLWTLADASRDADAGAGEREGLLDAGTLALADALSWLLAVRSLVLDLVELSSRSPRSAAPGRDAGSTLPVLTDLCHAETARAAGEVGRVAAELVCGGIRHPAWDADACERCYQADDLEALEDLLPGFAGSGGAGPDVMAADGSHPAKAGPCVRLGGMDAFTRLRAKLDGCLAGSRLARQRAADAILGR